MVYSLRLATLDDIPAMAQLAADAFRTDRNTLVKAAGPDGYDHYETMVSCLTSWIPVVPERGSTFVALDDASGEIAGWVSWGKAGYLPRPTPLDPPKSDQIWDEKEEEARKTKDPLERLGNITSTNFGRWMDTKLIPKTGRVMYFQSIVVAPKHEGKGVGTQLVRTATEAAEKDGVNLWVHSSDKAHHLFAKNGFEVLGTLTVDLDDVSVCHRCRRHMLTRHTTVCDNLPTGWRCALGNLYVQIHAAFAYICVVVDSDPCTGLFGACSQKVGLCTEYHVGREIALSETLVSDITSSVARNQCKRGA